MANLTQSRLRELLKYEPDTGIFVWLVRRGSAAAGDRAGYVMTVDGESRLVIKVDGVLRYAHRLAWLYMTGEWPKDQVDHEDLNSLNNVWVNLREATQSQNQMNKRRYRNNATGVKGIFITPSGKFRAQVQAGCRRVSLGRFDSLEDARLVRAEAIKKMHGEFARVA